ncbi:MAG: 50S ribosomal protein L19, partial [Deltaproteobacteria bacterium]|nr:50S ribosomal protein L19 [Deltaproteobacteria bacterium]
MDLIDRIEAEQAKKEALTLRPGETVRVHVKVVEAEKERTQIFEGI